MGRRRLRISSWILFALVFLVLLASAAAQESGIETGEVHDIGQVQVTAKGREEEISLSPAATIVNVEAFQTVDIPQNIGDIIKDFVIFDFRGESDLVPGVDSFQMRGFDSNRFVTAINGLNLRKTGGRKSSNIVDYSYLPPFLIEDIEILPGPHWALYPAKGIGGVLNLITKPPRIHESLKPDVTVQSSYGYYNTLNQSVAIEGSAGSVTYDMGHQKYATDGYLRNNDVDIDSVFGRVGYVFPSGGHVAFSASHADADRGIAVINDPSDAASRYNDDYPVVPDAPFYEWQDPSWDGASFAFRVNYRQPTRIGNLSADAYYSEEERDRAYLALVDASDPSRGAHRESMDTRFYQQAVKIMDEISFGINHVTTVKADYEKCHDGDNDEDEKDRRIEIFGGAIQHHWRILPRLTLTAGIRYEDVHIWVSNTTATGTYITGKPDWISRSWSQFLPKSFLTYELDDLAQALRDTSVSLGVSRIWRAPDYHGDYNPQGRPSGAWLEPEHGIGVDVVLTRRLWRDIRMKLNYSYYNIKDFIAGNSQFAEYTPNRTNPVPPGLEYMDYKINLDEVVRQGIEVQVDGHILDRLYFYLGYAFQNFENKGDELAGETETDDRAKHRVNGGLRYNLFKNTLLLVDYRFQSEQVIEVAEEIAPDEWTIRREPIDAYSIVDFGAQQKLFDHWGPLKHGVLKLYMKNAFDMDYEDTNGYPGTGRAFGFGLSFSM